MEKLVFVVTGGGNGIGREIVIDLLEKGHRVAAIDLDDKGLEKIKEDTQNYSNNLKTYILNITDLDKTVEVHDHILKDFKKIDGVINVAGIIQPFVKVVDLEMDQIKKVIDVNLYGTIHINKTFLPTLLKNETKSYLVNVSSMGGFLPVPGQSVYGASKAAVKLYTEGLYAELIDTNVSVSIVFPGAIGTNIAINSGVTTESLAEEKTKDSNVKMLDPKIAAQEIVEKIFKEKLYIYIGQDAKLMNFMYRRWPKKSIHLITKQMKDII